MHSARRAPESHHRAGCFTILDQPVSLDEQREFIRALPPRAAFSVAVSEGGPVVRMQDVVPIFPRIRAFRHVCEIATYVSLEARRQGVGAALFRETIQAAKRAGFTKIVATIRADNPDAVPFYRAQGFEIVGVARGHALVRDKLVDEVVAERFIQ